MSSVPRRRSVILSDTDYDYHTDYYDVDYVKSNGTGNNNTWIDTNVEMTWDIIVDTKVYGHYTYWDKIFHAGAAGGTGGVTAKWYTYVDLTGYSKITFSGCKVVNHGIVYVQVIDTSISTAVKTVSVAYGSLVADTWYDYEIDVTELSGTYKLQFVGGYWDVSGNTTSQTRYANIKLIV